jgi:hypothetical protein
MPMSGRAHQGYAGDPQMPMSGRTLAWVMPVIRPCGRNREYPCRLITPANTYAAAKLYAEIGPEAKKPEVSRQPR